MSLPDAVGVIQELTGVRLHRATVWRWALKRRLETYRVGSKVYTTRTALRDLVEADWSRPAGTKNRAEIASRGNAAANRIAQGTREKRGR